MHKETFRKMSSVVAVKLFLREITESLTLLTCNIEPERQFYICAYIHTCADTNTRELSLKIKILKYLLWILSND